MEHKRKLLHERLKTDINDTIIPDTNEYDNFIQMIIGLGIPKGFLHSKPTLLKKIEAMETKGFLGVGSYEHLRNVAEQSGNIDVVKLIDDTKRAIEELNQPNTSTQTTIPGNSSTALSQPNTSTRTTIPGNSSTALSTSKPPVQVNTSGPSVQEIQPPEKKQKLDDDVNESDPLSTSDGRYYDTTGRRGYLFVIKSTYKRRNMMGDIVNLKAFFVDRLKFEYKEASGNLTKSDIKKALDETWRDLNGDIDRKYYCFMCVILSHGDEKGIVTKPGEGEKEDGYISSEEIRQFYDNTNLKGFTGRPKLFFIQACRGEDVQDFQTVDDSDDIQKQQADNGNVDEDDVMISLPRDADVLLTFSNTPGYASYNIVNESYFIKYLIEIFKLRYETDHVEDMLISVRNRIAMLPEDKLPYDVDVSRIPAQMPCTWTTLTRRLKLAKWIDD